MSSSTISIVIPTGLKHGVDGRPILTPCLEAPLPAIESPDMRTPFGGPIVTDIVLITSGPSYDDPVLARMEACGTVTRILTVEGPFNYSRKVNAGARAATGDVLLFYNDDVLMKGSAWPRAFLDRLRDPSVGMVGPIVWNPDGTLNNVGDTYDRGRPRHVDPREMRWRPGLRRRLTQDTFVSGLTGAVVAISRHCYVTLGGFDEGLGNSFNDVDLCLKARQEGFSLLLTPTVEVVHEESTTRDPADALAVDRSQLIARHPAVIQPDETLPPVRARYLVSYWSRQLLPESLKRSLKRLYEYRPRLRGRTGSRNRQRSGADG